MYKPAQFQLLLPDTLRKPSQANQRQRANGIRHQERFEGKANEVQKPEYRKLSGQELRAQRNPDLPGQKVVREALHSKRPVQRIPIASQTAPFFCHFQNRTSNKSIQALALFYKEIIHYTYKLYTNTETL